MCLRHILSLRKKALLQPERESCAGILEQSMGARSHVDIGLSYQPARGQISKRLRRPGIESKESIPPANVAGRTGSTNTTTRFLCS